MKWPAHWYWMAWLCAALILVVTSLATIIPWRLQGQFQFVPVINNSLQPTVRAGDLLVIQTDRRTNLKAGDIVVYRKMGQSDKILIGSVASVTDAGRQVTLQTRTDPAALAVTPQTTIIGTARWQLIKFSYILGALQSPLGLIVSIYLPALLMLSLELNGLVRHYGRSSPIVGRPMLS